MNTAIVKRNTVGIFVAAKVQAGRGIWGAYMTTTRRCKQQKQRLLTGTVEEQNHNSHEIEVLALLQTIDALKGTANVVIHTDSKYLHKCVTQWLPKWRKTGGKTRAVKQSKMLTYGSPSSITLNAITTA